MATDSVQPLMAGWQAYLKRNGGTALEQYEDNNPQVSQIMTRGSPEGAHRVQHKELRINEPLETHDTVGTANHVCDGASHILLHSAIRAKHRLTERALARDGKAIDREGAVVATKRGGAAAMD